MNAMRPILFALISVLVLVATPGATQTGDSAGKLEAAKVLYRDARFAEALEQLHEVIVALTPQAHVPKERELLVDAHLYSALCEVALNAPNAAKESFKDMLRLDPDRRLDPSVYALR